MTDPHPALVALKNCTDTDDILEHLQVLPDSYRRAIVLLACDFAERALRFVPDGEERPRIAIETARAWAKGEATMDDVRKASRAAYAYSCVATFAARASARAAANVARAAAYATNAAETAEAACAAADAAEVAYAYYAARAAAPECYWQLSRIRSWADDLIQKREGEQQ